MTDAIFACDADGRLTFVSEACEKLTGYTRSELLSMSFAELAEAMTMSRLTSLRRQALHDPLTALPNRILLHDRAGQAVLASRRTGASFAILLVDLDGFKVINDRFGHRAGDIALVKVAERMRSVLRESDTIARIGGDEFAVLLPGASATGAELVADKIRRSLKGRIEIDGIRLGVGASVGIAMFPDDGDDVDALIQRADVAMYTAKRRRRGVARCPHPRPEGVSGPLPVSRRGGRPPAAGEPLSRFRLVAGAIGLALVASVAVVTSETIFTPFQRPGFGTAHGAAPRLVSADDPALSDSRFPSVRASMSTSSTFVPASVGIWRVGRTEPSWARPAPARRDPISRPVDAPPPTDATPPGQTSPPASSPQPDGPGGGGGPRSPGENDTGTSDPSDGGQGNAPRAQPPGNGNGPRTQPPGGGNGNGGGAGNGNGNGNGSNPQAPRGNAGDTPSGGKSASAPGRSGSPGGGSSASAPGRSGGSPGSSASAPGRTGGSPGSSKSAPGKRGGSPGGPKRR